MGTVSCLFSTATAGWVIRLSGKRTIPACSSVGSACVAHRRVAMRRGSKYIAPTLSRMLLGTTRKDLGPARLVWSRKIPDSLPHLYFIPEERMG